MISELLEKENFDVVKLEFRTKTSESFNAKIERDDKNYSNPIKEITDLSGIRIITYYNTEVDKISELIRSEFIIDDKNSIDKRENVQQDKFGYQSSHLIISLKPERSTLVEWSAFKAMKCEIQIRSILQHAWAAIDHKLRYKTDLALPNYVRRRLFRLSALLELADDEFTSIQDTTQVKLKELKSDVKKGQLDIKLDFNSIQLYFDISNTYRNFKNFLYDNEIKVIRDGRGKSLFEHVVSIAKRKNLSTLKEIDDILHEHITNKKILYEKLGKLISADQETKFKKIMESASLKLALILDSSNEDALKYLKKYHFKKEYSEKIKLVKQEEQ